MNLPEKQPKVKLSATEKRLNDDMDAANAVLDAMELLMAAETKARERGLSVTLRLGEYWQPGSTSYVNVRRMFTHKSIELVTKTIKVGRP